MAYWIEIAKSAFWKSILFFFDDPKKALITFALVTVVTAFIVWWFRSKAAFAEHWKSNIAIPIAGGIGTWLLVFLYYLLIGPGQNMEQIKLLQCAEHPRHRWLHFGRDWLRLLLRQSTRRVS